MTSLKRFIIILLAVLVLTGCSVTNKTDEKKEEYQSPKEYATEQSEYIMECIVNKDKQGLKSVFSEHISETHDLDKEIDEFFEFIDGEIVSYDEPEGYEGGYTMEYGKYKEKELQGEIKNIKTNKDEKYGISIHIYQIHENDKDKVGVNYISVLDENSWIGEGAYRTAKKYIIGGSE